MPEQAQAGPNSFTPAPVAVWKALDYPKLASTDPCDRTVHLGSFWAGRTQDYDSRLVKAFKECVPAEAFAPEIGEMASFYAGLVVEACGDWKPKFVARVLSSSESQPDQSKPQSLLVKEVCRRLGARDCEQAFFKSGGRPPMRVLQRLSGPDMLAERARIAAADLFIRPGSAQGKTLLLDDIYNTGASARVYASALKSHGGASSVMVVNLAAMRFSGGADGLGMLELDTDDIANKPGLRPAWIDSSGVFHLAKDCSAAPARLRCEIEFLARREFSPCPNCAKKSPRRTEKRKWWQIFGF